MEPDMALSKNTRGVFFAIAGGIGWGFSGACAQFLFQEYGLDPLWLTSTRMTCAGLALIVVALVWYRRALKGLFSSWRDIVQLMVFSIFGLMLCQLTYLVAIQYSNAGTATVLEYIGPVLIVAATCFSACRLPTAREFIAMGCVVMGTFLLATHGDPTNLVMSPQALFWGLGAAVTAAIYTISPGTLMQRHGSIPVVACGMLIGGAALCLVTQSWNFAPEFGEGALDAEGFVALFVGLILFGTAFGFTAYLQAVKDIGAAKASLIASVETVSATAFAVLWLGTAFEAMNFVGFVFIMSTVFLLANFRSEEAVRE